MPKNYHNKIVLIKLDSSTEIQVEADYYDDIFEIFDIKITKGTIMDLLLWIDRHTKHNSFRITEIDELCLESIISDELDNYYRNYYE
jgi:hypothetical protein